MLYFNLKNFYWIHSNRYLNLSVTIFLILSQSTYCQNDQKEIYDSKLDSTWSRSTHIQGLTSDGNWTWYTEIYDTRDNILHLSHTNDSIRFQFVGANNIQFSNDNTWFGFSNCNNKLELLDLQNFKKQLIDSVYSYKFSNSSNYVAALKKINNIEDNTLLVKNLKNQKTKILFNISEYLWHPSKNILLIVVNKGDSKKVILYNASTAILETIRESDTSYFSHLRWNHSGDALVFFEHKKSETDNSIIHYYGFKNENRQNEHYQLNNPFPSYLIGSKQLEISDDGKSVYFYRVKSTSNSKDTSSSIQIWKTDEPWIYPKMQIYNENEKHQLLTIWQPEANHFILVEDQDLPSSSFNINHTHALVFNKLQYEPLYKEYPNIDLQIKNLMSGETELITRNQYSAKGFVKISPLGSFVSYFKNEHWWLYDTKEKTTVNLTKTIPSEFEDKNYDSAGDKLPFGNPGWSKDEKFIILYDQYDIWIVSTDTKIKERITKGRENKVKYRISIDYVRQNTNYLKFHSDYSSASFNIYKGLILEKSEYHQAKTGYVLWKKNQLIDIVFESRKISDIEVSGDLSKVVYKKQKFNESPSIHFKDIKTKDEKILYKSNDNLESYDLGSAILIDYITKAGDSLKASLFYPAGFDSKKKYPMIVYIYEKLASRINSFSPPSLKESLGFNALKYTTNGYFVLYPDIVFDLEKPGISALNCVISATNKVLEFDYIDKEKLGLIGHSFGGYESAFISTQTRIFKAAVIGSASTNLISRYHSVGWNWNQPEIWRFENQQMRMGNSFHNLKESYYLNSPLHHAENITTPLLIWTGKNDLQVHWTQSIELFIALKRLDKKSEMILYDNEQHFILNPIHKMHLSQSIMNWFDKYCK